MQQGHIAFLFHNVLAMLRISDADVTQLYQNLDTESILHACRTKPHSNMK